VELTGYEYHAFLDFRVIWDDEYGNWGKLCHRLGNRPVASMADEFKLVQYENVVVPCGELFAGVVPLLDGYVGEELDDAERQEARTLITRQALVFYRAVAAHANGDFDCDRGVRLLLEDLDEVREFSLSRASRDTGGEAPAYAREPLGSAAGWAFLCAYRLFRNMGASEGTGEPVGVLFDRFGLKQVVNDAFAGIARTAGEPLPRGEGLEGLLMEILMRHAGFFTEWDDAECAARTAALLADREVKAFLLVHESGGETWFNKERLEWLLQWLFLAEMSGDLAGRDELEHLLVRMTLLYKAVVMLSTAAEKARYRPQQFLAVLENS